MRKKWRQENTKSWWELLYGWSYEIHLASYIDKDRMK